jgi:hypothetical protein
MTLRIIEEEHPEGVILALHGWLSAAEVGEVERLAAEARRPVTIDLVHVVGVDADGLRALRRLRGGGVRLTGASHFVELLLERPDDADKHVGGER